MFVPASNTQAIFQPGKGEGVILRDMPGLEQGAQKQLKVAELGVQQNQQLATTPSLEAWDADYYDYMKQVETGRKGISEKLAKGEITPAQASIEYNRFTSNVQAQAKLTKEQEKVYLDGVKVLNEDKTGVFARDLSLQNLDIYKDPRKYFDKVPGLREQFEATGGNISLWRAEFGGQYATPALQYNFEKHRDEMFKDIKPITTQTSTPEPGPNNSTIITNKLTTQADPQAAMQYHGNMVALATKGDFRATQYLKTGAAFIQDNVFDEEGKLSPNIRGQRLVQVMKDKMGYQSDGETATVNVNGNTVPVTNENIADLMLTAWTISNADTYVEKKNMETKQLVKSMNVNIGSGGSKKGSEKGLFTTLGQQFSNWNTTVFPNINAKYSTSESKNTPEYLNDLKSSVEGNLNVKPKTVSVEGKNFTLFPVTAKINDPQASQTENAGNLLLRLDGTTGAGDAAVDNLRRKETRVMFGYYDRKLNRWRVADDNYIKAGNDFELVVVNQYSVVEPSGYATRNQETAAKQTAGGAKLGAGQKTTTDAGSGIVDPTANDKLYAKTEKGKYSVYAIYPVGDAGVAQSLDQAYGIAGGVDARKQPKNVEVDAELDWGSAGF